MWIWWSSQDAEDRTRSTVPLQCCVPVVRFDVVRTATVAVSPAWLETDALSNVIERSAS
jgi:hypothetical protein